MNNITIALKLMIVGTLLSTLSLANAKELKPEVPTHLQVSSSIKNLTVISYHDIVPDVDLPIADPYSVSESQFINQLNWLKVNEYSVISFEDYIAAKSGKIALSPKSILLTFDDGFKSHLTFAMPLLKEYGYQGVEAVVGAWVSAPDDLVKLPDSGEPRSKYMNWAQLKEMKASGVFEIASHSYDSHKGIIANPQGNSEPAYISRAFEESGYEADSAYLSRVYKDLALNSKLIKDNIGVAPRAIVWPYGSYNLEVEKLAATLGMETSITLESPADYHEGGTLTRILISKDLTPEGFSEYVKKDRVIDPIRVMHVDLDYLYDEDPDQVNNNLSKLIDRIAMSGVNTVFLQAYADPKGDSFISEVYFPSKVLKTRKDLFNRVAWQIRTRARAAVYAWMPVYSFDFKQLDKSEYVKASSAKGHAYQRVSPFSDKGKQLIKELYIELSKSAPIAGILFHDDAVLNDFEDFSVPALATYVKNKLPTSEQDIKSKRLHLEKWSTLKENTIYEFTDQLLAEVKKWQMHTLRSARNMYAPVLSNPYAYEWTAQSYRGFSAHYDYVAVMAMPYMEKIKGDHIEWLKYLSKSVANKNTIFELQSVDWDTGRPIPAEELRAQMSALKEAGLTNFGYYPDDFIKGTPDLSVISQELSLKNHLTEEIK